MKTIIFIVGSELSFIYIRRFPRGGKEKTSPIRCEMNVYRTINPWGYVRKCKYCDVYIHIQIHVMYLPYRSLYCGRAVMQVYHFDQQRRKCTAPMLRFQKPTHRLRENSGSPGSPPVHSYPFRV